MAIHLRGGPGCAVVFAFLLVPGLVASHLLHVLWPIFCWPLILIAVMFGIAALPVKRKITPQQWADELEKHLLGTDGAYGWDDSISVALADERLENLRARLPEFDILNTPEKQQELQKIVEALRRGEIP